jgi:hypothetical protein
LEGWMGMQMKAISLKINNNCGNIIWPGRGGGGGFDQKSHKEIFLFVYFFLKISVQLINEKKTKILI